MSNFGSTYIEEFVGFLIFLGLIWWKLIPIARSLANQKEKTIRDQLDAVSNAQKVAENLIALAKEHLEEAKIEAVKIVDDAREIAQNIKENGISKAEHERDRILAKVDQDVNFELYRMRDELEKDFSLLLLEAAKLLVSELLDQDLHHLLLAEAINSTSIDSDSTLSNDPFGTKVG
jgi:F-type H+-transporting ATPase subunit b